MNNRQKRSPRRPIKPPGDISGELDQLATALDSRDPHKIANALGRVGRAYGMIRLAAEMGFDDGQIYRTFGPGGNPMLSTLLRALDVMGLCLKIERLPAKARETGSV